MMPPEPVAEAKDRLDEAIANSRQCGTGWADISRAAGRRGTHDWPNVDGPSR
jgi:hypothetical protein